MRIRYFEGQLKINCNCIVCGIISDRTQVRLLKHSELTLQKASDICRANEATASQLKTLSSGASSRESADREVLAVQSRPTPKSRKSLQDKSGTQHKRYQKYPEPRRSLCDKCGTQHQHYQNCPAYGLECYNCGSRNHFSKVCRSRPLSTQHRKVHSVTHDESDESDDFFYWHDTVCIH